MCLNVNMTPTLTVDIKNIISRKSCRESNQNLKELSEHFESIVSDSKILGLDVPFSELYQESSRPNLDTAGLFQPPKITPVHTSLKKMSITVASLEKKIQSDKQRKIVILGDGGVGKTILLKKCFLDLCKKRKIAFYAEVQSIVEEPEKHPDKNIAALKEVLFAESLHGKYKIKEAYVFLDGLDEATWEGDSLKTFWEKLGQSHCTVIVACRESFFNNHKLENHRRGSFLQYKVEKWEEVQSLSYAQAYLKDEVLLQKVRTLFQTSTDQTDRNAHTKEFILTNPFALSLFLYLLKERKVIRPESCHIYGLYDSFVDKFIEHECKRVLPEEEKENWKLEPEARKALMEIARKDYEGKDKSLTYYGQNAGIKRLTGQISRNQSVRFIHQSIRDFLVAQELIEAFRQDVDLDSETREECVKLFNISHRNDVNRFVKDAFRMMHDHTSGADYENCSRNIKNLIDEMRDGNVVDETDFFRRNHTIYYGTRFQHPHEVSKQVAQKILDGYEKIRESTEKPDILLKQSMAYGLSILATRLGEDDCINCQETQQACWNTICDFAKRLTPDEKEDEYIRAWTLVFYGDVSSLPEGTTILGYEDNGQIDWSIARNRRIKRLSNPNRRAYRILDLKALYLFHESRGWKDIQIRSSRLKLKEKIREVNAVKKCTESLPNNCGDDMKKLIEETQEKLLEGYRKYNLALRVYLFFNK